ncbi:L,D-transpeptidase [Acidiphilium iwatense]|uniref:L,D-transpeptidase n=1 Tax=Acidiphilium iwatense TaxID=768198 RepID=A0ABS9E0D0_9PROT|nr:L,D-transpeptidase [Acidiphilium sp. AL]MCF3948451.1 L,D-transpeptidase [Acidiphilium iwatense]
MAAANILARSQDQRRDHDKMPLPAKSPMRRLHVILLSVTVAVYAGIMAPSVSAAPSGLPPFVLRHLDQIRIHLRCRAFHADWRRLTRLYPSKADRAFIVVDIARQRLDLFLRGRFADAWPVSTSRYGIGRQLGSFKTPTGVFRVTRIVGYGAPSNEVLGGDGPTDRTAKPIDVAHDIAASRLILGRILELQGLQPGWNRGGSVDTARRDIYIHGTANIGMLGEPASRGCVQMAPGAVLQLARLIPVGALVLITQGTNNPLRIPGPLPKQARG